MVAPPAVHRASEWGHGHLREWRSPGPTIDSFIASLHLTPAEMVDARLRTGKKVRALRGPIGSGKTTGIMGGCVANAQRQPQQPDGREAVRFYKLTIMRTDYRLLWSSFIEPFWLSWFPKESSWTEWQGGNDQPADHLIRLNSAAGKIKMQVSFRAISELRTPEQISNFWRGQLPNDVWLEEADAFSEDIYQGAYSRLGRGTDMRFGGPTCPTIFLGTNAPLIGSWMHRRIVSGRWRAGIEYFNQPSGRSPQAENLHNLPPTYYGDQIRELDERNIARLVDNEFVMPRAGHPVHETYRDSFHGAPGPLKPDPRVGLVIGIDPRTHPSAAFCQQLPNWQWRFLDEQIGKPGVGSQRFAEMINFQLKQDAYKLWNNRRDLIRCVVDPSAAYGADKDAGELNWLQRVEKLTDIKIVPARSNKAKDRRDSMAAALRRTVEDGRPAVLIGTGCPMLRAGMGGMFHFGEINLQGGGSGKGLTGDPVKNEYADICEAAEYAVMEYGGLDDASLQILLTGPGPLDELGDRLVASSLERGGTDNITAVLVRAVD